MKRLQRAISVQYMCIEDVGETSAGSCERVFSGAPPIWAESDDRYFLGGVLRRRPSECGRRPWMCYLSSPPKAKAILSKLLRNGNATGK